MKSLENTLLNYHNQKMSEINKIIKDTWRVIYFITIWYINKL